VSRNSSVVMTVNKTECFIALCFYGKLFHGKAGINSK